MHPSGVRGRLFAWLMERMNTAAYRRAAALIDPAPGDAVLEIGFGTGALLARLAPRLAGGLLAGVDPSLLMVRQARRRLSHEAGGLRLDLRQGDDRQLEGWPAGGFSQVAALHCFQFFRDPDTTLRECLRVLRPGGRLVLILRSHARRRPPWLPNPISRSADEVADTLEALTRAGYVRVTRHPDVGSSAVLTAVCP
jgi:ubiquinone/menaquinone biosynthesis C-methylase UbiE